MKTNKTPLTWNKNRDPACRRGKKTKNQSNFFHHLCTVFIFLRYKKKITIMVYPLIYYHIPMINMLSFTIEYLNSIFHIHEVDHWHWFFLFCVGPWIKKIGKFTSVSSMEVRETGMADLCQNPPLRLRNIEYAIYAKLLYCIEKLGYLDWPLLLLYMTSVSWVLSQQLAAGSINLRDVMFRSRYPACPPRR